jgi:predicted ribosome quality control (RQC) complex YloA/Tae2 family protein
MKKLIPPSGRDVEITIAFLRDGFHDGNMEDTYGVTYFHTKQIMMRVIRWVLKRYVLEDKILIKNSQQVIDRSTLFLSLLEKFNKELENPSVKEDLILARVSVDTLRDVIEQCINKYFNDVIIPTLREELFNTLYDFNLSLISTEITKKKFTKKYNQQVKALIKTIKKDEKKLNTFPKLLI